MMRDAWLGKFAVFLGKVATTFMKTEFLHNDGAPASTAGLKKSPTHCFPSFNS